MYVSKREEIGLVVVFFLVIAFMGFAGLYFSENSTLTGAVIGIGLDVDNVINSTLLEPLIENNSETEMVLENISPDETEETIIELPHEVISDSKESLVEEPLISEPIIEETQLLLDSPEETFAPTTEVIIPTNTFKSQNFGIVGEATSSTCGNVTADLTLTADVSNESTCFFINASHITLDCDGFLVNHSNISAGYGVDINGFDNVTIKNCVIEEGATLGAEGIYVRNSADTTIFNNTIVDYGDGGYPIYIFATANNTNISGNNVTSYLHNVLNLDGAATVENNILSIYGGPGDRLVLNPAAHTIFNNNSFYVYDDGFSAISYPGENTTISNNYFYQASDYTNSYVIRLNLGNSTLENNEIIVYNGTGIGFENGANLNYLINNNLTNYNDSNQEIEDLSSSTDKNYLIYNNSFGKIEWSQSKINVSVNGTLGLNHTFFIDNLSIAVNLSNFSLSDTTLNTTTLLTLYDVYEPASHIYKLGNVSTDLNDLYDNGIDCLGLGCNLTTFGLGRYTFNISSFSSYGLNLSTSFSNTNPTTSQHTVNSSSTNNLTDDTLNCWVNGTDGEQSLLAAYWTWYNGSTSYQSGTTEITNNTLNNVAIISSLTTNRNDNWTCEVFIGDGSANNTAANQSITISDYTCDDTISSSITLTSNISSCTGIGLNITGNDLTLDCNDATISGTGSNGLLIENLNNITIQDCNFANFTNGTYFRNVTNIVVNNSVFFNHTEGITIYDSVNITIENNNISNTSFWGINVWDSNVTSITNNYLYNLSGNAVDSTAGIYLIRVDKGHIDNNLITSINSISGIINVDPDISVGNYSGNITNNNVTQADNGTGIYPYSHVGQDYLYTGNYIYNASIGYNIGAFNSGNITSDTLEQNTKAFQMNSQVENAEIWHTNFTGNTYDVQSDSGPNYGNVTIYNSSINRSLLEVGSTQYVYYRTLLSINVSDSNGIPINAVSVQAKDVLGTADVNGTTDSTGLLTLAVMPYYHNNKINYIVSPSTIIGSLNNYTYNTSTIDLRNLTESELNITIDAVNCGSSFTSSLQIGNNYLCTTAGLHFLGEGHTIFGQGFNLTGANNGDGINLTNTRSMQIENLQIDNFTSGLFLHTTNHSIFRNLTIINNSYGIVFNRSNNNTIYDSVLDNNSNFAVVSENDGATNNSLVNISIEPENVSITGDASVYLRWYVDVNVTLASGVALPNAQIQAFFNDSTTLDQSAVSGSDGTYRLELAEWKKNSTDVFYITPHNISVYFTYQGVNVTNETSINLTTTNNTVVQLSLDLDCTGPSPGLQISSDTTLCPGTYTGDLNISSNDVTLTCDDTTINPATGVSELLVIDSRDNVTINSCIFGDTTFAVQITNSTNVTVENNSAYTSIFECTNSRLVTVANSTWERANFDSCNESLAIGNEIGSQVAFWASIITDSFHTVFRNNTWNDTYSSIKISPGSSHYNTSFYHNTFKNIGGIYVDISTFLPNNNYEWNTTVSGYPQGNNWEDYCNKGADSNSDGFADAKSSGKNDWPFNETQTTLFRPGDTINDFGPVFQACVTEIDVGTGTSTTSSTTSASASSGSAPPAAAPSAAAPAAVSSSFYDPDNIKKYLNANFQTLEDGDITKVKVTLSNTGTKRMLLNPELFQDIDDPFFLVTTKTLGGKDSLAAKIVPIYLSPNPISGRLLKAEIVNPEEITLEPGQTLDKTIEIKSGLSVPRQIKIQFASSGETVKEQEITINSQVFTGTAVDLDTETKTLDLYTIIVSGEKASQIQLDQSESGTVQEVLKVFKKSVNNFPILSSIFGDDKERLVVSQDPQLVTVRYENTLTGGVVSQLPNDDTVYYLEINFNKDRHTSFADVYGPYYLKSDQVFIFAQQYLYEYIKGEYDIVMKVYKGQDAIVDKGFDVNFK
ncbi:right-handed parallel beta-helix repeat-containing protein [Candidatus Woesearchaeota archaeon]|nr:right-handed parallel beta-helix repeat-containing protein [Candidatus Woesearchaeota archaeon]